MHSTGTIKILARVASARMNGQLWLMNALTDRFIVLHGRSEALWQKTEQGATVAELIDDQVMLNRSAMTKFGFHLGEVTLSFTRR